MQGEKRPPLERASTAVLWAFLFFCLGFSVARMESVQRTIKERTSPQARTESLPYARDPIDRQLTVWSSAPHPLDGGAVLIGAEFSDGLGLVLVGEQGQVLKRWNMENRIFNPEITRWWGPLKLEDGFSIDDAQLLPGGDLVFIQIHMGANNYRGQRLVRLAPDSRQVWQVTGNFHHAITIAGEPRRIYAITSRLKAELPEVAPHLKGVSYLEDYIESYAMNGQKLAEWSVVDAFARSPYRNWLAAFEIDVPEVQRIATGDGRTLYDLFHLNSVQYLDAAKAPLFPSAQGGDLLLSFRTLNALAVLRPETGTIVWASRGPWRHQHSAQVADDGKLYLYDNEGRQVVTSYGHGPVEQQQSRLLRYDPARGQAEELFASAELHSFFLGNYHALESGSWVISSPQQGRVLVVSPEKQVTWQLRTVPYRTEGDVPRRKEISVMRYYSAQELEGFHLDGGHE